MLVARAQLLVMAALVASSRGQLVTPQRPAPSTWHRTLCGAIATVSPPIPGGSVEDGRDYPGNDIPLRYRGCDVGGCEMATNATALDCKAKCAGLGLCVGYVFAAAACSGRAGAAAVCWTKSSMDEKSGKPGACRTSQRVAKPGSNGTDLATKWASEVSAGTMPLQEYPRPQMVRTASSSTASGGLLAHATLRDTGDRSTWQNLNGLWEWEPVPSSAVCCSPEPVPAVPTPTFGKTLNNSILVPFPMESCLSGVAPTVMSMFHRSMFYRLTFSVNSSAALGSARTLLHFGAVDWQSVFWVNGREIGNHTGGFDGIDLDITDALCHKDGALHELIVYVYDPSDLGFQPKGKQRITASQYPGGGQYTSTSGIWQTVWLEAVPTTYISAISLDQNSADTLAVSAAVVQSAAAARSSAVDPAITFRAYERGGTQVIATGTASAGATALLKIAMPRLWEPGDPYLYDITATTATDAVVSYFGLRTIRVGKEEHSSMTRPLLNGDFTFFAGWLDQSWWPDGQYTAPTDEALASDIAAVSMFGLNMVRLHMKVNPERWYYHADRMGVVVFQDMPQFFVKPAAAVPEHIPAFIADLRAMIVGRKNHPSILQFTVTNEDDCWPIFNATAGYDLPRLLALVRELAPHHLVDMNSGGSHLWQKATANASLGDVNDFHSYPAPQANRDPNATATQYAMVGEFGGAGAFVGGHMWANCFAYLTVDTPLEEAQAYINMTKTLLAWSEHLSASVYTQITDVEEECDGFLNYDRTNKFNAPTTKAIAAANQAVIRAHSSSRVAENRGVSSN